MLAEHYDEETDLMQDLVVPFTRFYRAQAEVIANSGCDIVGISLGPASVISCINLGTLIHAAAEGSRIILGGSGLTPNLSKSLYNTYGWIDAICFGEGEIALESYLRKIANGGDRPVDTTRRNSIDFGTKGNQIDDLNQLPTPDYSEFFEVAREPDFDHITASLVLPVEGSRGCWHQCRAPGGCNFCSLNLQWEGYRLKSTARQAAQIKTLTGRYGVSKILFVDNAMPAGTIERLTAVVKELSLIVVLLETRPNLTEETIKKVSEIAIYRFFLGLEALDSASLARINKGVSLIQNIYIMKLLEQYQINSSGCIMFNIPGTNVAVLDELDEVIDCVKGYRPLYINYLILSEGSPFHDEMLARPDYEDRNNQHYWQYLPEEINNKLSFSERYYLGPLNENHAYAERFSGIREKLLDWGHQYWALKKQHSVNHLFWLESGVKLHDFRSGVEVRWDLSPDESELFKAVDCPRSIRKLKARYGDGAVEQFISRMQERRLIFTDGIKVLGLPILLAEKEAAYRYLDVLKSLFSTTTS